MLLFENLRGIIAREPRNSVKNSTSPPLTETTASEFTVVYDGHCKVCGRLVGVLREWDTNHVLEIVPSQADGVRARFPWIPAPAYQESLQVIARNGRTWQGAAAIEQLLTVLPRGRWVSWVFKLPFARGLAERLYRSFARHRYRLGCGEHCPYQHIRPDHAPRE